jgi:hypothetical protein
MFVYQLSIFFAFETLTKPPSLNSSLVVSEIDKKADRERGKEKTQESDVKVFHSISHVKKGTCIAAEESYLPKCW